MTTIRMTQWRFFESCLVGFTSSSWRSRTRPWQMLGGPSSTGSCIICCGCGDYGAVAYSDPGYADRLAAMQAAVRSGRRDGTPIEDVVPDVRGGERDSGGAPDPREADLVRGRTLTSWPSLQTDIRNAGGTWIDTGVQVCAEGPNVLITSRKPGDLPAFCKQFVAEFRRQPHSA